jgi:transposase
MTLSTLPDDPQLLKQIILNFAQEKQVIEEKSREQQARAVQEQERATQEQERATQEQTILKTQISHLQQMIAYLRRKMFGPRSEKIDENQLLLFGESLTPLVPAQLQMPTEVPVNRPRGHGRRVIPANLPREKVLIDLAEEEKPCPDCGTMREKIGEDVTEQLEFIPAKLFVRQFIRPKYACGSCEAHIAIADKPSQVVEKGLAGPGLIAHIATSKYADHLPLYRLEGIFARYGIEISRSTMCDWMADVARLAGPLVRLMRERILSGRVIHTDDTTVPVQAVGKTKTARLWVYIGDERAPYNLYEYSPDRKQEHPHL